ncbi:MAG TPA: sugar-binding domain-containing protein [Candidatus Limnocylindrales bacterium]
MRRRQASVPVLDTRTIDVLTEIATRYYLRADSQTEIARDLGLDPSTVSRYLKRARDEGIVHVEIRPPRRTDVDLGRALARRYGLARVVVAPTAEGAEDDGDGKRELAATAAGFIEGLLRNGMRLGISWGRTVAAVVAELRPGSVGDLAIAQLAGGVEDPNPGIQGHELVRRLADLYPGSRVHYLHAPAIVDSEATGEALLGDRIVQAALEAARASELAVVGIGQMDDTATLVRGGHVSLEDWARLVAAGGAGNVNTCFFDDRGRALPDLRLRTIAITLDELRAIDTVVAVAGGIGKVRAIRGALTTGAIDVLVTDELTAAAVLAADRGSGQGDGTAGARPRATGQPARATPLG